MAKLTLSDLTSGFGSVTTMNANNALIEAALENTLSLDGTTPNSMGASLDMNSNQIINLADGTTSNMAVTLAQLQAASVATDVPSQTGHNGKVLGTDGSSLGWYSSLDLAGTLDVTGAATLDSTLNVSGAFTSLGIDDNSSATTITIDDSTGKVLSVGKSSIEAWDVTYSALQLGGNGNIVSLTAEGASNTLTSSINSYYDGNWKAITTAAARKIDMSPTNLDWDYAASVTADTTQTFTTQMRMDNLGDLQIGKTDKSGSTSGHVLWNDGQCYHSASGVGPLTINRITNDGALVVLQQDGVSEGSISVSGTTVTYGSFCGAHWSQLQDKSNPEIPKGTVVETVDEMCEWTGEDGELEGNEQLVKFKVSNTAASKKVYGVFSDWDEDGDANIHALGATVIRVTGSVEGGDLLESNGDGTARVQADDIVRSSTIGKATFSNPSVGEKLVPVVLYCG